MKSQEANRSRYINDNIVMAASEIYLVFTEWKEREKSEKQDKILSSSQEVIKGVEK